MTLVSKLKAAAHDRCKAMRPAGYPGGVEELFEYRAAVHIERLEEDRDYWRTQAKQLAQQVIRLQEQIDG